jgi:Zn-dependent protease with chaperone function
MSDPALSSERLADPGGPAASVGRPERLSFFDEQARRRRRARWLSLVCLLIASGIGVVLSTVITPLLLVIAGLLLKLLVWLGFGPSVALQLIHAIGGWAAHHLDNFSMFVAALEKVERPGDLGLTVAPLAALSTLCLPGLGAAALVWIGLRRVLVRVGSEDLVLRLKARAPDPRDLEERQLANIVEEMAIAAGVPAPRLLLVDSPVINAAAIGRSHDAATILVTRGLVERLDRRETSGVVAHLVATIGEGDLGLSASVVAVFQTFGFFLTILDLPFRWSAFRALGGIFLVAVAIKRSPEAMARAGELLEEGLDSETAPDVERTLSWVPFPRLRKVLIVPLLPLMLLSLFLRLVLFLWTALFLGPPLSILWGNRRYSADAVAVQLTRDPDGLGLALRQIAGSGVPTGGEGREYLFVHAPRAGARRSVGDRRGMTLSLHPMVERRVARLVRLGASSLGAGRSALVNFEELARHPVRALVVGFLLLLLIPLFAVLVMAAAYITAIVMTMSLAAGLTIVSAMFAG